MKNSYMYIGLILLFCSLTTYGQGRDSIQQTIDKGKSDLLEVLMKSDNGFNFGLDISEVKASRGNIAVPYKEMDFKKLLKYRDQQGMESVLNATPKAVAPLVMENKVVTTISVSENEKGGFSVAELINLQYQTELNQLPEEVKQNGFKDLSIVFVPNLFCTIYNARGVSFTSYNGRSLREGIDPEVLMQELKADAIKFQKKYGEIVKKGKIVN